MNAKDRLSETLVEELRGAIEDSQGKEILAVGSIDHDGVAVSASVVARGDESSVVALYPYMEKGDVVIHNHPSGLLVPSKRDLAVAAKLGQEGIGFYIIDNLVEEIYVVTEPVVLDSPTPISEDELVSLLEPGGRLSRREGYELRESQIEMLRQVCRGFNDDSILVLEAGTGVGKSFAYLIPLISWLLANRERAVLSTATITLQHQIMEKDIPMLLHALNAEQLKVVMVKGRGNYLCLRRLGDALAEPSLFVDGDQLSQIGEWAESSSTGCRTDLPFLPSESVWSEICSESDSCHTLRCPDRGRCFYLKMRREAHSAQLLIANHHLLFSDLSLRLAGAGFESAAVLPPFQRLIIDEAHGMEKNATSFFTEELSAGTIHRQLNKVFIRRRGRLRGMWVKLHTLLASDVEEDLVPPLVAEIHDCIDELEACSVRLIGEGRLLRLSKEVAPQDIEHDLISPMKNLKLLLGKLNTNLCNLIDRVSPVEEEHEVTLYQARTLSRRLNQITSICDSFCNWKEQSDKIFWLNRERGRDNSFHTVYYVAPLNIAPTLREAVFLNHKTVVCTSATLTVRGNFDYWMNQVGLSEFSDREVISSIFPSPFPYTKCVLLGITSDAPSPEEGEYIDYLSSRVVEILTLSEGSGLVLFTNLGHLNATCASTKPLLQQAGIPVLRQGEDNRNALLDQFRANVSSVLFATSSFWEGVDIPGESLKIVIICRLPFPVPTDPILAARGEAIELEGGSSFSKLSLPEATIRFRQGFGRLIRHSQDRGAVIVLDPRIVKKGYGRFFLESIPDTLESVGTSEKVLYNLEAFLYK